MRMICTLLVLTYCVSPSAYAQFEWGGNAGVNLSNVNTETNNSNLLSFQFSAFGISHISNSIVIQPSLGYRRKGYKMKGLTFVDSLRNERSEGALHLLYDYLQLNTTFLAKLNTSDNYRFYTGVGAYLAYLMEARWKKKTSKAIQSQP